MTVLNISEAKEQAEHLDSIIYSKSPSDDEMINELRYYWEKNVSDDSFRFNYAVALSHSNNEFQRRESLHHFESLMNNNLYQKDSLYNIATTHYSLDDFESARLCCEELYRQEPDNRQIRNLHLAILYKYNCQVEERKKKQGENISIAVGVGAAMAAFGLGLAFALRKK